MNYIKRLQQENEALREGVERIDGWMLGLESYLQSSKFNCGSDLDGYVNVGDVLLRLGNLRNLITEANDEVRKSKREG